MQHALLFESRLFQINVQGTSFVKQSKLPDAWSKLADIPLGSRYVIKSFPERRFFLGEVFAVHCCFRRIQCLFLSGLTVSACSKHSNKIISVFRDCGIIVFYAVLIKD